MSNHFKTAFLCAAILQYGYSQAAFAGALDIEKAVTPAVTLTDNVCLASENEKAAWIAMITPEILLVGEGNRLNFDLLAAIEINSLSDSQLEDLGCNPLALGDREQFSPRLKTKADAILVSDWLYLEADALIDQNRVDPFQANDGGLNRTGNTNNSFRYGLSPFLAHRFGNLGDLLIRYEWDEVRNSTEALGDSSRDAVLAGFGNVAFDRAFSWELLADYDKVEFSSTPSRPASTSELSSARMVLGYQVTEEIQLNGFYGKEQNDFVSISDEIDGTFWDAGIRWAPNLRMTVEAGTGERFFGDTPRFSIRYRHRNSVFFVSYKRDLTYDRYIRTLDESLGVEEGFGEPVDPATGSPNQFFFNDTTTSTSPILDERFTIDYSLEGRWSSLRLAASRSEQVRAEDGRDAIFEGVSLYLDRALSRKLSLYTHITWDQQEPLEDRSENVVASDTIRIRVGAEQRLSYATSLWFEYGFIDRGSEDPRNEYQENQLTVSLRFDL